MFSATYLPDQADDWQLEDADYIFRDGSSSEDLPLHVETRRVDGRWR